MKVSVDDWQSFRLTDCTALDWYDNVHFCQICCLNTQERDLKVLERGIFVGCAMSLAHPLCYSGSFKRTYESPSVIFNNNLLIIYRWVDWDVSDVKEITQAADVLISSLMIIAKQTAGTAADFSDTCEMRSCNIFLNCHLYDAITRDCNMKLQTQKVNNKT